MYRKQRDTTKAIVTILLGALFFFHIPASGQSLDSIAVVSKDWRTTPIKKGVTWKQGHFDDLFQSQQEINFVEIDLRKYRKRIRIAADSTQLKTTSQFALENAALVAVNGGFFDTENGGSWDYVKVANKVINVTKTTTARANAILLIDKKGVDIQPASSIDYAHNKVPNILLSGPLLVYHGLDAAPTSNAFNNNRHPRSAIGVTADQKLILIVVDGRNSLAAGMRLPELAKILRWLGARDAMNLDGGGSSTLYVKGATENSVVNHPSDNKVFDHEGLRPVANIICLKE